MKRTISLMLTGLFVVSSMTDVFAQPSVGKSILATALPIDCTVGNVDVILLTFVCRTPQNSKTYRVTPSTVFELGSAGSSFPALKSGMKVKVAYHSSDTTMVSRTTLVADTVTATP